MALFEVSPVSGPLAGDFYIQCHSLRLWVSQVIFIFTLYTRFVPNLTLLKWAVSMLHRLVVLDADRKVRKWILSGIHHLIWPRVEPLQSKLFDLLAHNGESNNAFPVLLLLKKVFKKSFSVERVFS